MRYPAIQPSRGSGRNVQKYANDPRNYKPPARRSFPANTNRSPVGGQAPTPAKQAANYQSAAKTLAGKVAKQAARNALNLHPLGRVARTAMDLADFADMLFIPGKEAVPGGFPGYERLGVCAGGGSPARYSAQRATSPSTRSIGFANSCLSGQAVSAFAKIGEPVPPNMNAISTFSEYMLPGGFTRGTFLEYWYRPPGTLPAPVVWQAPQPAVAPVAIPASNPHPNPTPVSRPNPRARPQRRPGISFGRELRPNSLGTIELSVTGSKVGLRINGQNRPARPGQTERKARVRTWGGMYALYRIADWTTEAFDFLEVLAKATGYEGEIDEKHALEMIEHIATNLHQFDPEVFLVEYLLNELEDQAIGRLSGAVDKQRKKLGIRNPEMGWAL